MDIFKLAGSIFIDTEEANKSISKTSKQADTLGDKFANGVKTAGKWAVGVTAGATAVAGALLKTATSASDNLDKVQKGAQKLGMSYETYQELDYALNRSGASISDLAKGFKGITNDLSDFANGSEKASAKYDALGVSLVNTDGTMKSSEQVMKESLKILADMDNETERNALANDIFGNSYANLIPFLESGSEGIEQLTQNAHDLGLVMSDEAVDGGAKFGDMLADVKDSFGAVITQLGAELFPIIEELLQWVLDHMPEIQEFISGAFDVIREVISIVIGIIRTIMPIVQQVWDFVKPILDGVLDFLKTTFGGGLDEFLKKIKNVCEEAVKPFKTMAEKIGSIWESIKEHFKLPHFTIDGSLNPMNWFTQGMPRIGVEWYAKGGIMNDPTIFGFNPMSGKAMVGGEAGAEAIAPLSDLEVMFKKWSGTEQLESRFDAMLDLLDRYLPMIANNDRQIVLDSGALVGNLIEPINRGLNRQNSFNKRGMR